MSSNNSTLLTTPENANGNVANLTVNIQDITLDEPHHIGDANGEEDKRREDEENEVDDYHHSTETKTTSQLTHST